MTVRASDPFVAFAFGIEIVGDVTINGYFTEVSGIEADNEVVTHLTVDEHGREIVQQIPGRGDGGEIVLKRGFTTNVQFWKWRDLVVMGDTEGARCNITITIFDRSYMPSQRYQYMNVWPSKITVPELSADSDSIVVEELILQHEGGGRIDL